MEWQFKKILMKPFHVILYVILGRYFGMMLPNFGWKFIVIFNWEKKKFWTNQKFVYIIFIRQKISYFCRYIHVRKSPDNMIKSMMSWQKITQVMYFEIVCYDITCDLGNIDSNFCLKEKSGWQILMNMFFHHDPRFFKILGQ